ncbi:MAG: carboxymuconolactone decarboxylase family protein [Microbacteriaceae bacterium]
MSSEMQPKMSGRDYRVFLFGEESVEAHLKGPTATLAPWLTEMSDRMLFEDVWQRDGLAVRDRSLVTIAGLTAIGRANELRAHLRAARGLGITQEELINAIVQLAFYAGLPPIHAALAVAQEVFAEEDEG